MKLMLDEGGVMALKNIILGTPSFSCVRQNGFAFVDKTRFIDLLEKSSSDVPVFLRPRRFGKTFLAYTLFCYYDKSLAGQFDENFKGTWIYSHKTAKANSYCCLRLDFSSVSPDPALVKESMTEEIAGGLSKFSAWYPQLGLPPEKLDPVKYGSPSALMKAFLNNFVSSAKNGERLYILIDEYDHFANYILASDKDAFRSITSTAQSRDGFIKQFYACLKQFFGNGSELPIAKFFITGVSAVSLDSLTSGFNIATNISSLPQFNAMAGFTHEELSKLVDETIDFIRYRDLAKDRLMEVMEKYYDGYVFSPDCGQRIFNPNMCLVLLDHVARTGKIPDVMPGNTGDDTAKLGGMLALTDPDSQKKIIDSIFLRDELFAMEPGELNLNRGGLLDWNQAVWMLYYLGYLSITSENNAKKYACPNEITYKAFIEYLAAKENISPLGVGDDLTESLRGGDIGPLVEAVEDSISGLPGMAFAGFNERTLQLCFYTIIQMRVNVKVFVPSLEVETGGQGRADLLVENKTSGPSLMLELKYISKSKADDVKCAKALAEAKAQLGRYKASPKFMNTRQLKAFAVVFVGPKAARIEEA